MGDGRTLPQPSSQTRDYGIHDPADLVEPELQDG